MSIFLTMANDRNTKVILELINPKSLQFSINLKYFRIQYLSNYSTNPYHTSTTTTPTTTTTIYHITTTNPTTTITTTISLWLLLRLLRLLRLLSHYDYYYYDYYDYCYFIPLNVYVFFFFCFLNIFSSFSSLYIVNPTMLAYIRNFQLAGTFFLIFFFYQVKKNHLEKGKK